MSVHKRCGVGSRSNIAVATVLIACRLPKISKVCVLASCFTEHTTTLAVENMTCALCAITVRKAMGNVAGVKTLVVHLDAKIASVTYDPSVATAKAIGSPSMHVGYPAAPAS